MHSKPSIIEWDMGRVGIRNCFRPQKKNKNDAALTGQGLYNRADNLG